MSDIAALVSDHLDIWTAATERKNGAGRGGGKRISLYGIERLRTLILDLAVLGRLVPQDEGNESATVLLKATAAARLAAVQSGKARKPKPTTELPNDLPELPLGWCWTQLAELAEISPSNASDDDVEASFVPMALVTSSIAGEHDFEVRKWGEIKKGFTHFADGDVALAKITPCFENGKAAILQGLRNGIGAGTTELHVARPWLPELNRRFLLLTMKTGTYIRNGEAKMTGTAGQKRITRSYFEATPLPLPPLAEQGRIVAKVDELMELCDALEGESAAALAAHQALVETLLATLVNSADAADLAANWTRLEANFDALFTTDASVDAFRQTILELAVRGKLTSTNFATVPGLAFPLPVEWNAGSFNDVLDIQGGSQPPKSNFSDAPKPDYVQLIQIRDLGPNPQPVYVPRRSVTKFCTPNDIMVGRYGASVGKVFWGKDGAYNVALVKIIDRRQAFLPGFLYTLLSSPYGQTFFAGASRSAQAGFNKSDLKGCVVFVPSKAEQGLIVSKVEALISLCKELRTRTTGAGEIQRRLADAIVERAAA